MKMRMCFPALNTQTVEEVIRKLEELKATHAISSYQTTRQAEELGIVFFVLDEKAVQRKLGEYGRLIPLGRAKRK